jgi:hypothetical protein
MIFLEAENQIIKETLEKKITAYVLFATFLTNTVKSLKALMFLEQTLTV